MIEFSIEKKLIGASGQMNLRVSWEIESGSIVAVTGKSGAGKTTLLKLLAGLIPPDAGHISVNGQCWFDTERTINKTVQKRNIGFVFQDYAMFPHMTVQENLEFALPGSEPPETIDGMLHMVEMENMGHLKPSLLSGGQCQRIALCRAFIRKPELLLLDEPLTALDEKLRRKLQQDILKLHKKFAPTIIIVSHNIAEIARLVNEVIILETGQVADCGKPHKVLRQDFADREFILQAEIIEIDSKKKEATVMIGQHFYNISLNGQTKLLSKGDVIKICPKNISLSTLNIDS